MSNASIVSNVHAILDEYERGRVSATDVEKALEAHLSAAEGLPSSSVDRWRSLAYELVIADLESDDVHASNSAVQACVEAIRAWLESLPK